MTAQVEAYFSPRGGVAKRLVEEIDKAQKSVHLAIFSFTALQVAGALSRAQARGVEIKVIMDQHQRSKQQVAIYERLRAEGIEVYRSANKAFMHSKYAVIDGATITTCSYNWTKNAEQHNNENMLIIRSPEIAQLYEDNFLAVFGWHIQFYSVKT